MKSNSLYPGEPDTMLEELSISTVELSIIIAFVVLFFILAILLIPKTFGFF